MKKLRVLALVMAFVMAMTMFVGCGKEKEEEKKKEADTIKIGFIGPLTGETAQYGENVRNGAKMYIDEVNAAGGINGKQIEFIDYDDKSEPTDAASAYSRLVDQDGVCAIIGPVTTNCANAVAELAAEDGIPVITSSGTGDSLTEVGKTFFRTCYKDSFQGTKIAQYMSEILGYKKVAVLYNSAADYSVGLANAFKAECEKVGITIVANESYAGGDTDYKSQLTNIAAAAPEAIFFPFYYSECYMAAQQAKEANVNVPFFGGDGFAGLCEIESVDPKVVEGFIFSDHFFVEDKNTAAKSFTEKYESQFGSSPLGFAYLSYDAAQIVVNAIKETDSTDWATIVAAMKKTDIDCLTGHYKFDEQNNPLKQCAMKIIKDGKYTADRMY